MLDSLDQLIESISKGPFTKNSLAKLQVKGQDHFIQQQEKISIKIDKFDVEVQHGVFGIFDGHGTQGQVASRLTGKKLPLYLKQNLQEQLQSIETQNLIQEMIQTEQQNTQEHQKNSLDDYDFQLTIAQHILILNLPSAIQVALDQIDQEIKAQVKEGGTTATFCIQVGWFVLVATVGDSLAYADTGSEVIQISHNHRVQINEKEKQRVVAMGGELDQSSVNNAKVGPLRVWPPGLAMSRSLGDLKGRDIISCQPEFKLVAVPWQGLRILVASDGLWDTLNAKTGAHATRELPVQKASTEMISLSKKNRTPKDDMTIVALDIVPSDKLRMPLTLSQNLSKTSQLVGMSQEAWQLLSSNSALNKQQQLQLLVISTDDAQKQKGFLEKGRQTIIENTNQIIKVLQQNNEIESTLNGIHESKPIQVQEENNENNLYQEIQSQKVDVSEINQSPMENVSGTQDSQKLNETDKEVIKEIRNENEKYLDNEDSNYTIQEQKPDEWSEVKYNTNKNSKKQIAGHQNDEHTFKENSNRNRANQQGKDGQETRSNGRNYRTNKKQSEQQNRQQGGQERQYRRYNKNKSSRESGNENQNTKQQPNSESQENQDQHRSLQSDELSNDENQLNGTRQEAYNQQQGLPKRQARGRYRSNDREYKEGNNYNSYKNYNRQNNNFRQRRSQPQQDSGPNEGTDTIQNQQLPSKQAEVQDQQNNVELSRFPSQDIAQALQGIQLDEPTDNEPQSNQQSSRQYRARQNYRQYNRKTAQPRYYREGNKIIDRLGEFNGPNPSQPQN